MSQPKLIDSDGQPYTDEPQIFNRAIFAEPLTEFITIRRDEYDSMRAELSALRKATKRAGKDSD